MKMTQQPHIVFAGGGTAGHLFPGLAVATRLRLLEPKLRITFIGTGRTFESERVIAAGCEYLALASRPLPRRARDAFRFLTDNLAGFYAARRFLREQSVSLVVGLGGYASAPAARAAISRRIPFILLEQNVVPGRATRWLSRRAALVCGAFDEVRPRLASGVRLEITGNPLHAKFDAPSRAPLHGYSSNQASSNQSRSRGSAPRLLVLGGSGGARSLNQHLPLAVYKAGPALAGWDIVHQCGQRDLEATATLYAKLAITARVTPFIDDMPGMLVATDLAVSRAGGTTLAELAAASVPAILLPFPKATDDHQRHNAEVFRAAGACRLVDQREVTGRLDNHLAAELRELAADLRLRQRIGAAAHRLSKPNAAHSVARLLLQTMAASIHQGLLIEVGADGP